MHSDFGIKTMTYLGKIFGYDLDPNQSSKQNYLRKIIIVQKSSERFVQTLKAHDWSESIFKESSHPKLLIYADGDELFNKKQYLNIEKTLNVDLVHELKKAGHFANVDFGYKIANIIHNFINALDELKKSA